MLSSLKVGSLYEGTIVPVRYDASDHSKVVIDVDALEAQHLADRQIQVDAVQRQTAARVAQADAQLAGTAGPTSTAATAAGDTVDKLAKLAALKNSAPCRRMSSTRRSRSCSTSDRGRDARRRSVSCGCRSGGCGPKSLMGVAV